MKIHFIKLDVHSTTRAKKFGTLEWLRVVTLCWALSPVCLAMPTLAHAQEPQLQDSPLEATVSFDSVRLTIAFDEELFDLAGRSVQSEQMATACRVWREAFSREQGPWGFGIASDVTCMMRNPDDKQNLRRLKNFDHWLLSIQKVNLDERAVIETKLCRLKQTPQNSSSEAQGATPASESTLEEKCEAQKIIPWTPFRVRLLRHRAFVRLLSASLLEQLPFISIVTRNIVHFDRLGIRGLREPDTDEVSFPPPPPRLMYVDVRYDAYEHRFRLKSVNTKEAIYRTMNRTGVVWLVNKDGRGAMSGDFTQRLKDSFLALTTQFQLDLLKFERERIRADAQKYKEKSSLDVIVRGDYWMGLPLVSMTSARGATALVGIKAGVGFGGVLGGQYLDSKYVLETQLQEKDSANKVTTSDVSLKEFGLWLQPQVGRGFSDSRLAASYQLGARFGFFSSGGKFLGVENLPQQQLSLSTKELALGLGLGIDVPLSENFVFSSEGQFDFGMTAQSTSLRGISEAAWVPMGSLARDSKAGGPLKVGVGIQFSSLGRRFASSGAGAKVETMVTLNGVLGSLFIEKIF